jgi:hypothetical protein
MSSVASASINLLLPLQNGQVESMQGVFIMFYMITNIYNKNTKRPTLMELFTATGKLEKFF